MKTPELPPTTEFARAVGALRDPRRRLSRCAFSLYELLTMAFVAVVCGADDWAEIGVAVAAREAWWVRTLGLTAGRVPSASTFKRVLPALTPTAFVECFEAFTRDVAAVAGSHVALDAKALRGGWTHGDTPLKLVHAWAVEHRVLFAQEIVADGDDLGAMKALIARLDLPGALVTVDAGGASKPLAGLIGAAGAAYAITIKGNQQTLHEAIALRFLDASRGHHDATLVVTTHEEMHGDRHEVRTQWAAPAASVPETAAWPAAASVLAQRYVCTQGGRRTEQWRYVLSSVAPDAPRAATMVRAHWSIETQLHWVLDVAFDEDHSRLRDERSQLNFATLRRFALAALTRVPKPMKRISVKNLRFYAALNDDFLLQVILKQTTRV